MSTLFELSDELSDDELFSESDLLSDISYMYMQTFL